MYNDCLHDVVSPAGPSPEGSSLWLNNCGYLTSRHGVGFINGGYCCPHLVERGRGAIRFASEYVELGAGDMFCLLDDCVVEYFDVPEAPWVFSWVHLTGDAASNVCHQMGFTAARPWRRGVPLAPVAHAFSQLRDGVRGTAASPYLTVSLLYRIVAEVCEQNEDVASVTLVERAESRMETFLHDRINITELSRQLRVDRTTLFHAFRSERGCSPIDVLRQKRVGRAGRMLRTTDAKLAVIAAACGFSNEKYLIRTFRQLTGVTPGEYRQKQGL